MIEKLFPLFVCMSLLVWGNAVFAHHGQAKTVACDNCHNSTITDKVQHVPNLAGQNSTYLIKQIKLFNNNSRIHPLLNTENVILSHDDIKHLAIYYQNIKPEYSAKKLNVDAELLYEPCSACHGDQGEGVAPFPRLSGQKSSYLEQQLVNFKNGTRQNSLMQSMTMNLSEQDIKLLANYLGK